MDSFMAYKSIKKKLRYLSSQINEESYLDIKIGIGEAMSILANPKINIVFGGHFKAGKSSLINTLLRKSILPTGDLPETGVSCFIKKHWRRKAIVHAENTTFSIPCKTIEISKVVSRLDLVGKTNKTIESINQVDIYLPNVPIHRKCYWIDTVGINDNDEMDDRARKAVRNSDVLVWVSYSKQFLSLPEQVFLRDYVALHGPNSIFFVFNVFLSRDLTNEWNKFLSEQFSSNQQRLMDNYQDIGFNTVPKIYPVAALGERKYYNTFGIKELRIQLKGINSLKNELVISSRLNQIIPSLLLINDKLQQKVSQINEILNKLKFDKEYYIDSVNRRNLFLSDSKAAFARFITDYGSAVQAEARNADPDDFRSAMETAAELPLELLINTLNNSAHKYNQKISVNKSIQSHLVSSDITVNPRYHNGRPFSILFAIILGGIGTAILPVIGSIIGGVLGFFLGKGLDKKNNEKRDNDSLISSLEKGGREAKEFAEYQISWFNQFIEDGIGPTPLLDPSNDQLTNLSIKKIHQITGWKNIVTECINLIRQNYSSKEFK